MDNYAHQYKIEKTELLTTIAQNLANSKLAKKFMKENDSGDNNNPQDPQSNNASNLIYANIIQNKERSKSVSMMMNTLLKNLNNFKEPLPNKNENNENLAKTNQNTPTSSNNNEEDSSNDNNSNIIIKNKIKTLTKLQKNTKLQIINEYQNKNLNENNSNSKNNHLIHNPYNVNERRQQLLKNSRYNDIDEMANKIINNNFQDNLETNNNEASTYNPKPTQFLNADYFNAPDNSETDNSKVGKRQYRFFHKSNIKNYSNSSGTNSNFYNNNNKNFDENGNFNNKMLLKNKVYEKFGNDNPLDEENENLNDDDEDEDNNNIYDGDNLVPGMVDKGDYNTYNSSLRRPVIDPNNNFNNNYYYNNYNNMNEYNCNNYNRKIGRIKQTYSLSDNKINNINNNNVNINRSNTNKQYYINTNTDNSYEPTSMNVNMSPTYCSNSYNNYTNTYSNNNNNYNNEFPSNTSSVIEVILKSIQLEDLIVIEEKMSLIYQHVQEMKSVSKFCIEWWIYYAYSSFFNKFEYLFEDKLAQKEVAHESTILEFLSIILIYEFSRDPKLPINIIKLIQELFNEVYENTIIIEDCVLNKYNSLLMPSPWINKIQDIILSKSSKNIRKSDHLKLLKNNNVNITNIFKNILDTYSKKSKVKIDTVTLNFYLKKTQKIQIYTLNEYFKKIINQFYSTTGDSLTFILKNSTASKMMPVPYINPEIIDNKVFTLVLDLDETLISFKINENSNNLLRLRPGLCQFLNELKEYYELIIFTAGTQDYANPIIDIIENRFGKVFSYRLYRQHAIIIDTVLAKDISKLGRDLSKVIIIDNMPHNFRLQKENGIFIKNFYPDSENDTALFELIPILKNIARNPNNDVRIELKKYANEIFTKISTNLIDDL